MVRGACMAGCVCVVGGCMVGRACVAGGVHGRGRVAGGCAWHMANEQAVRILLECILFFN